MSIRQLVEHMIEDESAHLADLRSHLAAHG